MLATIARPISLAAWKEKKADVGFNYGRITRLLHELNDNSYDISVQTMSKDYTLVHYCQVSRWIFQYLTAVENI